MCQPVSWRHLNGVCAKVYLRHGFVGVLSVSSLLGADSKSKQASSGGRCENMDSKQTTPHSSCMYVYTKSWWYVPFVKAVV
jgi:hypothetical protein